MMDSRHVFVNDIIPHGLISAFVKSKGHDLNFAKNGYDTAFWDRVHDIVLNEEIPSEWLFDTVIVDEGQDFEARWYDLLRVFTRNDTDILWLEDPNQRLNASEQIPLDGFVGFTARSNHRSPQSIANFLRRTIPSFDFEIANHRPGMDVGRTVQGDPAEQPVLVARIITKLVDRGFEQSQIAIISLKCLTTATLAGATHVGSFKLDKFTGQYDEHGEQVRSEGRVLFETVHRFKGQQRPAVIVTDLPKMEDDRALRLLYAAATRATVRLELVAPRGPLLERLRG